MTIVETLTVLKDCIIGYFDKGNSRTTAKLRTEKWKDRQTDRNVFCPIYLHNRHESFIVIPETLTILKIYFI